MAINGALGSAGSRYKNHPSPLTPPATNWPSRKRDKLVESRTQKTVIFCKLHRRHGGEGRPCQNPSAVIPRSGLVLTRWLLTTVQTAGGSADIGTRTAHHGARVGSFLGGCPLVGPLESQCDGRVTSRRGMEGEGRLLLQDVRGEGGGREKTGCRGLGICCATAADWVCFVETCWSVGGRCGSPPSSWLCLYIQSTTEALSAGLIRG